MRNDTNPMARRLRVVPALLVLFLVGLAQAGELVIAHSGVSAADIDAGTLKGVFLGKVSKLPSGDKISIATLKSGATHEGFLKARVGKSGKQFLGHWRKLAFSGKGKLPPAFASEAELVAHVKKTPGAIGYISDATAHEGVKVLPVK